MSRLAYLKFHITAAKGIHCLRTSRSLSPNVRFISKTKKKKKKVFMEKYRQTERETEGKICPNEH